MTASRLLLEDDTGSLLLEDGFRLALEADAGTFVPALLRFISPDRAQAMVSASRAVSLASQARSHSFTSPARAG